MGIERNLGNDATLIKAKLAWNELRQPWQSS